MGLLADLGKVFHAQVVYPNGLSGHGTYDGGVGLNTLSDLMIFFMSCDLCNDCKLLIYSKTS